MKIIYMTLGLLAATAFNSFAQIVDMQAYIERPLAEQIICNGDILDTSKVICAIYYNGPDTVYSGGYVEYRTPFTRPLNDSVASFGALGFGNDFSFADSGKVLFVFPNDNQVGAGHIAPFTLVADSINYLYDWELYSLYDSLVFIKPPYVVGKAYGFFFYVSWLKDGVTGAISATDPYPDNNLAVVKIYWCSNLGIGDMIAANEPAKIEVYPNPAKSVINFSFDFDQMSHAQAVLRDVTGRIVFVKNYGKAVPGTQKYTIDISKFAAGVYSLEFNTDEKTAVTKFNIVK